MVTMERRNERATRGCGADCQSAAFMAGWQPAPRCRSSGPANGDGPLFPRTHVASRESLACGRGGFTLWEIVAACFLLSTASLICLQFFAASAAARNALRQRDTALEEAANLMEQCALRPWDELTAATAGELKLSPQAARTLGVDTAEMKIAAPSDDPSARRITISVGWQDRDGAAGGPVRLVAWRFRSAEQ
jgi:hypothetical protein